MSYAFSHAVRDLFYWEGHQPTNDPSDKGGPTSYGISLRLLKLLPLIESDLNGDGHVDIRDIHLMTPEKATAFYRKHFWLHYQMQAIRSELVSTKMLNVFVNMRGKTAARVFQRALGCVGISGIKEDGYIGPICQREINEFCVDRRLTFTYLSAVRAQQESVYRLICQADPSQLKYLKGWVRRARDQKQ